MKNLYYILILLKVTFAREFIDLIQLSLYDIYFIVFDTGLYLHDFNTLDFALIHEFNQNEYKTSNNLVNITRLNNRHKAYIFCLVNENLFLFNEYTYKVLNFKIKEIDSSDGNYYNIIPYKIENNNISFFIALNNDTTNLFFYFYNFNLNEGINEPKVIKINNMNIQNKMIRCQINLNSTFIICYYYSTNNNNRFFSTAFKIKNINFSKENTFNKTFSRRINQIKVAISSDDNFFVCFLEDKTPICYINYDIYNFKEISGCEHVNDWKTDYKVLYFRENDNFMLISRHELSTTTYSNLEKKLKKCKEHNFEEQTNIYSIIYNNGYKLVNTKTFKDYKESIDISELANIKRINYIDEANQLISNSKDNNELITNLNKFISNSINIDYIDENNELIIPKNEMVITFTSTEIQKNNENSNYTTINLGECENILKKYYNISEESKLYILKIDKEQKGKNYPQIEYQVFYPSISGKMEILNLSLCDGTDIELSIPIVINGTIDKYNPKSNYYNDICSKATSKSNTDIPLGDRRNEFINKNMSLCEENCELTDYDNNKKKAKCSCNAKKSLSLDNIELNGKNLFENLLDFKRITNIEIIKCYKIVFNIKNIKKNYGFYISIFVIILYFICLFAFYCKSKKNLINEIFKIIEAKNKGNQINKSKPINIINKTKFKGAKKLIFTKTKKFESTQKRIKNENKSNIMILNNNRKNKKFTEIHKKVGKINDKYKNILECTETELNSLSYIEALKKDKRTYIQYYCSLLKKKQIILFSFYPNKDYNSQIIKSFLFFFFYTSDMTVNALFFTDDTMHKIYVDSGLFDLSYQLPQIIYSFLISSVVNFIIEYLSLSEEAIISIKSNKFLNIYKSKKLINKMKTKFCFFFIISFILLSAFGYYISCFCCIYENTQLYLIKDTLMSFGISLIYPILFNLIPGIFRIGALRSKKGDKVCMYKLSKFIEFF